MPEFDLDDPRLDLVTEPVRAAVAGLLKEQNEELEASSVPWGIRLALAGIAWEAVMVALEAREAELETAEILSDPATMGALGEAEAEVRGSADAVAAIVNATGGTAFYNAGGEAVVLVDNTDDGPPAQLISVCGHGSPVAARLGKWLPGYSEAGGPS